MAEEPLPRRTLLAALAALPLGAALAGLVPARAEEGGVSPTPACDDEPTPDQTEGPYWTPNSPQRNDFTTDGAPGQRMALTGAVIDTACRPVPGTVLDFWQCDGSGIYDNAGYKLRGHFFSDDQGAFRLTTVKPGLYPGRTRHFHVKLRPPGGQALTTQLYFPDEPGNRTDGLYQPELQMSVAANGDASYTFVVGRQQ